MLRKLISGKSFFFGLPVFLPVANHDIIDTLRHGIAQLLEIDWSLKLLYVCSEAWSGLQPLCAQSSDNIVHLVVTGLLAGRITRLAPTGSTTAYARSNAGTAAFATSLAFAFLGRLRTKTASVGLEEMQAVKQSGWYLTLYYWTYLSDGSIGILHLR